MAEYHLPGMALGVVEDGKVTYTRTAGELVAGGGQAIDADTLFKIASNTKAMTTGLLARLVDAGKLRWDDPVVKYLPHFSMNDPWITREMRVRDLLIHNSGLREGAGDLMLWPEPNMFTRADIIAGLQHLKPVHSFRSHYDYDNLLYIVAGEVAAAAGGATYEELMRREVFEAVGLKRCQVGEFESRCGGQCRAAAHVGGRSQRRVPARPGGRPGHRFGRRGRRSLQPERHAHLDAHVARPAAAAAGPGTPVAEPRAARSTVVGAYADADVRAAEALEQR